MWCSSSCLRILVDGKEQTTKNTAEKFKISENIDDKINENQHNTGWLVGLIWLFYHIQHSYRPFVCLNLFVWIERIPTNQDRIFLLIFLSFGFNCLSRHHKCRIIDKSKISFFFVVVVEFRLLRQQRRERERSTRSKSKRNIHIYGI